MSIYVDIHVLQTVPPSCVNRDDTVALRQPFMAVQEEQEFHHRLGSTL